MKKEKVRRSNRLMTLMILCGLLVYTLPAADPVPFTDIAPTQAAALIKEKETCPLFTILDVRTANEFSENRIRGALNIDVTAADFKEKVEKLNRDGTYLVYCRGGVRSARAMNLMKEWGFKTVYNLAGGIMNWQGEKLPLAAAPGQATALSAPPIRPDSTPYSWQKEQKRATIPFRLVGNHIHIEAEVNGQTHVDLILDTGMPAPGVLLFDGEAIQALNLTYSGEARVGGAGGGFTTAKVASGVTLKLGDLQLQDQTAIVQPDAQAVSPSASSSRRLHLNADGVIGNALFSRFIVAIDYDRMVISISEPGNFNYTGAGQTTPIEFISGFPFIDVNTRLEDGKPLSLKMVLDIGAAHTLVLNLGSQPEIKLPKKTIEYWSKGNGPEISERVGRVRELSLAKYSFAGVPAFFHATRIMPFEKDGLIGSGILRHFNLLFDYSRQTLIIEPNTHFSEPFEFFMSGFQVKQTEGREFEITHVLPDSPAAEAKLREGDRIMEVNDRPANQVSLDDLFKTQTKEGETLKLVIRRGDTQLNVVLKLRRLI